MAKCKIQNAKREPRTRLEKARWKLGPEIEGIGGSADSIDLEMSTGLCNFSNCSSYYFPLSFGLDVRNSLVNRLHAHPAYPFSFRFFLSSLLLWVFFK